MEDNLCQLALAFHYVDLGDGPVLVVITVTLWDILPAFIVFYKCFSDQYI